MSAAGMESELAVKQEPCARAALAAVVSGTNAPCIAGGIATAR